LEEAMRKKLKPLIYNEYKDVFDVIENLIKDNEKLLILRWEG
jgi:hypothetical protein